MATETIKAVTIQACSTTFCVDAQHIESIHNDSRSARSFLSELKKNDDASNPKIFSLSRLIGKQANGNGEQQKLILVRGKDSIIGLLVDTIGHTAELPADAIHALPPALSKKCFDCFPEIAVIEETAVPFLTPESIHLLTTAKR